VIVEGSIVKTSPASISNLAAGRHHLEIVLSDYATEERDVDVKSGETASQGMITLRPITPPEIAATAKVTADGLTKPARRETGEEVAPAKKTARIKPPSRPVTEKPASSATRQVAAAPATAPSAKTISKPAPAPKPSESPQRRHQEFEGSAPGG
jgi:hypothetical protein